MPSSAASEGASTTVVRPIQSGRDSRARLLRWDAELGIVRPSDGVDDGDLSDARQSA